MAAMYSYSEARQNLASLLERAVQEGEVRVKRKDGQIFVIKPEPKTISPLDVEGIDLDITTAEIVQFIHESRRVIPDFHGEKVADIFSPRLAHTEQAADFEMEVTEVTANGGR